MYLYRQASGVHEETYFSYTIAPILDGQQKVVGLFVPNFDDTRRVIAERRIKFIRHFATATVAATTKQAFFEYALAATKSNLVDVPLLAFYDIDQEAEASDQVSCSTSECGESRGSKRGRAGSPVTHSERSRNHISDRPSTASAYFTGSVGCSSEEESHLFPLAVPAVEGSESFDSGLLPYLAHVREEKRMICLGPQELAHVTHLPSTSLGDKLTTGALSCSFDSCLSLMLFSSPLIAHHASSASPVYSCHWPESSQALA